MMRPSVLTLLAVLEAGTMTSVCHAQWKPHSVLQMDGDAVARELPAEQQIVTERWNRVVAVPYIVYMPEKDRVLMLVGCDYPHQPFTLASDDHGATWSDPRPLSPDPEVNASAGLGTSLTYLGAGRVILSAGGRWSSSDFGETWEGPVPIPPASNGQPWYQWDPYLVDRDPATGAVIRLTETGYNWEGGGAGSPTSYEQGFIRFSTDEGRTWSNDIRVPQWHAVSEVALLRASNGNIVAACRTDMARQYFGNIDHYEGLGVCISEDDGQTWSPVNRLYDYGRHHPCMVLMPAGEIVMTYVVRLGYPRAENGFPQFGIEAIISRDNGESWDIPHRYVLAKWSGNRKGANEWWASSQATSTVLLPDESLLTAYGTGYRSEPNAQGLPAPRDVGLIHWRLGPG
jgi:hypothetical protein